jgi:hypothetical protein
MPTFGIVMYIFQVFIKLGQKWRNPVIADLFIFVSDDILSMIINDKHDKTISKKYFREKWDRYLLSRIVFWSYLLRKLRKEE